MSAPGSLTATFSIEFHREYHVGAGHGRGTSLDSALFTDGGGGAETPVIRYAHGVLRQAVFGLLAAGPLDKLRRCKASGSPAGPDFCPRDGKDPPCPVCRVFGSAARPSPWRFGTMAPETPGVARARTVPRTAVDPVARRALEGQLFSQELGDVRVFQLSAERIPLPGDTDRSARDELALLVAAARTVAGVGSGCRRGRGECTVRCIPADGAEDEPALLERFRDAWLGERPADRKDEDVSTSAWAGAAAAWVDGGGAEWEEIRLAVRLLEPVVAGSRPLVGNLLPSEPFVPGTLLLGALAGRVLAAGHPADEAFLRAFRGGGVLFPDLVPVAESGGRYRPGLAAPRDLSTCGNGPGPAAVQGHGVWSHLFGPAQGEHRSCPKCRDAGKGDVKPSRLEGWLFDPSGGFATDAGETFALRRRSREETKIEVDPATGRVANESLYHRETIPAGTLLAGTLRARPGALDLLRDAGIFTGAEGDATLRLGKRHGRGYGLVRLAWTAADPEERTAARKLDRDRIAALLWNACPVAVVCNTRLVLRDRFGRCLQSLTAGAMGLEGVADAACAVHVRPVGGFWRHVGLPRRGAVALAPGSVLRVSAATDADALADRLVALAYDGAVGERTAEGFGRIAVAPFAYDWLEGATGPAARVEEHAVPIPRLREGATDAADPLGRHSRRLEVQRYAAEITDAEITDAKIDLSDDRWRSVARMLWTHATDPAALVKSLETGGGDVSSALADAHALRSPKHLLLEPEKDDDKSDGGAPKLRRTAAWAALVEMIGAASTNADAEQRALRIRALAEALADTASPGKVAS
jgi:hypothetical protein